MKKNRRNSAMKSLEIEMPFDDSINAINDLVHWVLFNDFECILDISIADLKISLINDLCIVIYKQFKLIFRYFSVNIPIWHV